MSNLKLVNQFFQSEKQFRAAQDALKLDQEGKSSIPGGQGANLKGSLEQNVLTYGRMLASGGGVSKPENSAFPAECNLIDDLPPVYDQGMRGTCVAHAVTALVEYYYGCKERLSMQYLFEAIKRVSWLEFQASLNAYLGGDRTKAGVEFCQKADGLIRAICEQLKIEPENLKPEIIANLLFSQLMPDPKGGAFTHEAFTALENFGICKYELWPYSALDVDALFEDRLSLPPGAEANARRHIIRDGTFYLLKTPNNIEEYKGILSGANGRRPMPVAIGAYTFASWMSSDYTRATGMINMPIMARGKDSSLVLADRSTGGHEMLVVGYKDEDGYPGGGYFIVRNSWGTKWAAESPYPGYGIFPYAYLQCFVDEAGTILQDKVTPLRIGFSCDEEYDQALAALDSDGTGAYAPAGGVSAVMEGAVSSNAPSYMHGLNAGEYMKIEGARSFPEQVNLVDRMPPVYDQGFRGTCVAQAWTALMEYYEGTGTRLSPEFLYMAIRCHRYTNFHKNLEAFLKGEEFDPVILSDLVEGYNTLARQHEELAGVGTLDEIKEKLLAYPQLWGQIYPPQGDGSNAMEAIAALQEYGVCAWNIMPYSKLGMDKDDGRYFGQLPPDSVSNAAAHKLRTGEFYLLRNPNNVEDYKAILSGARGRRRMPVVIGVNLYASNQNPYVTKTGEMHLPIYGQKEDGSFACLDTPIGGHAMVAVGYEDKEGVPGGGYFIVRNSWGEKWGEESPWPGYARIPYAYIECYGRSAATILQNVDDGPPESVLNPTDGKWAGFLVTADRDRADRFGNMTLRKGTRIIVDADGKADKDNQENRRIFETNGFTWSPGLKQAAEEAGTAAKMTVPGAAPEQVLGAKRAFLAGVERNLTARDQKYCFPDFNLPFWTNLVPGQLRVKKIDLVEDITDAWIMRLKTEKLIGPDDAELARQTNAFKIYELRNGGIRFLAAVIYLTAVSGGKCLDEVSNRYLEAAEHLVEAYASGKQKLYCFAQVIGTGGVFASGAAPFISKTGFGVLCRPGEGSRWVVRVPETEQGTIWLNFLQHFLPEDLATRTKYLLQHIKDFPLEDGHPTPQLLAERLSHPLPLLEVELQELRRRGEIKIKDNKIACNPNFKARPGWVYFIADSFIYNYIECVAGVVIFACGWKLLIKPDFSNRYNISVLLGLGVVELISLTVKNKILRRVFRKG